MHCQGKFSITFCLIIFTYKFVVLLGILAQLSNGKLDSIFARLVDSMSFGLHDYYFCLRVFLIVFSMRN